MSKLLPPTVAIAVTAVLAGCASTPAEDDPTQVKLRDLDTRVARIERVVSNQSLVQLAQNLDGVQEETRRLRGRIEELEHSNDALKKQLANTAPPRAAGTAASPLPPYPPAYGAGSNAGAAPGGSAASGGAGAAAAGSAGAAGAAGGPGGSSGADSTAAGGASAGNAGSAAAVGAGSATGAAAANAVAPGPGATDAPAGAGASSVEQAVYSQAFSALKAGSYSVAITGFKDFISSYPNSPLTENAQYWLGEAYYVTRSYDEAGNAFRTVLQKYPQSRKAPDAMLKLGYTQYELKRYPDARKTLQEVSQKYPDSDASRLATERLKRIPASAPKG
jgi:tol-pal system protein YbgF